MEDLDRSDVETCKECGKEPCVCVHPEQQGLFDPPQPRLTDKPDWA